MTDLRDWLPLDFRTPAATEALHPMIGNAFDSGFRRVEWKCDAANMPSRRAAACFGSIEGPHGAIASDRALRLRHPLGDKGAKTGPDVAADIGRQGLRFGQQD